MTWPFCGQRPEGRNSRPSRLSFTEPLATRPVRRYASASAASCVTKLISEINFLASAKQGDMIEMGLRATEFGRTSLTMRAKVRNIVTGEMILTIDKIVFVSLGEDGKPAPHGFTEITYDRDRLPLDNPL